MKQIIARILILSWSVLLLSCEEKPRQGLYYCAGNILEIALLKNNGFAFQIISKRKRQTNYISGKAMAYKETFYVSTELFNKGDTKRLFFEYKSGQIQITEDNANPSAKTFEGIYDFFSADKFRSQAPYLWNVSYAQTDL
ncbi:MAG: hypothetical protein RMJ44_08545 [Cytophagales bacterium]|nr:hypothetical protein [Bernardetiaceae bacterium]MDW8211121.1 hypothetical protein [Cytophagales bacterium]